MKKILVVRNDRLGDLMLILPAIKIIKSSIPNVQIDCLANENYEDLSELSNDIDNMILDVNLHKTLANQKYDFSISFFSTFNIGYKLWRANIKKRYAPSTKLAKFFYNKRVKQKRSKSLKPEYVYNNDLVKYFLEDNGYKINKNNSPFIRVSKQENNQEKSKKNIYIHPFTGGSSKTLSENDFIMLCTELHKLCECKFILHCDEHDYKKCRIIENQASHLDINTIKPTSQLVQMFININQCDLFIAGSTGPLHVAAALNKKTVGFYPAKKSSTSLRWSTINDESKKLLYEDLNIDDKYIKVDIPNIANEIYNKLLK